MNVSNIKQLENESSNFPSPEVYESEYRFWPWGKLIDLVANWIELKADKFSVILDYMCGTGYLLNKIHLLRKDLKLFGCSLNRKFVEYGKKFYPHIKIEMQNVFDHTPLQSPNIVICTGGLHHLNRSIQPKFLKKVYSELQKDAFFVLGEELIRNNKNEVERREAVLEMFEHLISYVKMQSAPKEVERAVLDLRDRDLSENGEYKTSKEGILRMIEPSFVIEEIIQAWPGDSVPFGDFLFICRRK